MRTRLDEIVEHELGRDTVMWAAKTDAIVAKHYAGIIAERAFRLAKEMAWGVAQEAALDHRDNPEGQYRAGEIARHIRERVQPAPAGEKCPWTFAAQMPCDKPNGHDGAHGPAGEEKPRHIGVDAGGRTDYVPDRRSGKDRRKP